MYLEDQAKGSEMHRWLESFTFDQYHSVSRVGAHFGVKYVDARIPPPHICLSCVFDIQIDLSPLCLEVKMHHVCSTLLGSGDWEEAAGLGGPLKVAPHFLT